MGQGMVGDIGPTSWAVTVQGDWLQLWELEKAFSGHAIGGGPRESALEFSRHLWGKAFGGDGTA